ncbi:DNA-binding protein [Psychrobacillus sp. NEAU-3TGS]|uniref:PPC domain-containing DNA-binding protein n=1 Tax=Psychrobacillus sp. NEAU-3TGS TaxID=2995412 RepID=UPI0024994C30|nr:PPC domain-containing DNA-binding protein [Psychrobacillus sp. NEAU-3TGS]MDI2589742.1 DNA-binding protein [Psychrobacillus sp. NEAU-3TGS]
MDKLVEKVSPVRVSQSVFDEKRGIIMGFLAPGEDLIEGFKKICQKHDITSGTISCIGSLSRVSIIQINYENNKMFYSNPLTWETPVELLSGNGIIGKDEQGELDIHFHGVFVDHRKSLTGGHFLNSGNPVAATVEFTILVSEGIQPKREVHKGLGYNLFSFYDSKEID